ncbi:hypothetical protein I350_06581 [Cryptococcus amylolentus CBS 6273]|uniref:N-acetyltransferase domain-containing protein n=1 Tax=Cryptococcus amylolentus CBS 6273 TaxID=1296118 RepID=A0A1E3JPB3_9TREE|nr:hypothetical protein I350_06581 [Cryptococcus amylolentus CBS 6273]
MPDPTTTVSGADTDTNPTPTPCPIQLGPTSTSSTSIAYIPLKGAEGFRLTPAGEGDLDDLVDLYNRPELGKWACRRPYPYIKAHTNFLNIPANAPILTSILRTLSLPSTSTNDDDDARKARASFIFNALREESTGKVVGMVFIGPSDQSGSGSGGLWEVGYDLSPEYWGRGLGRRMVQGALEYAKWAGVTQVCAFHQPENTASAALLSKIGFTKHSERLVEWPEEKGGGKRLCYECRIDL